MCHSLKSDHDLASESPDSPPELHQSEPKTFDQEQWVVLELELPAVSEDNADSESVSMDVDDKSQRVPQRPLTSLAE